MEYTPTVGSITFAPKSFQRPEDQRAFDELRRAHAAALETIRERDAEIARLRGLIPTGSIDALDKIGTRLHGHYADRFCLTQPTLHTDNERQVILAALKCLAAGIAYRRDEGGR